MAAHGADKQKHAFRPRARIMKTLGEELISSDSVALIELVKNSYDADASYVVIRFTGPMRKGEGSIEVTDDGFGMDIDTVRRIWLEPATPSKKLKKLSPSGRRVLGEKGIGRFAAARLSAYSELFTRQSGSKNYVYAEVDWTQFDNEDMYLDEVEIITESRLIKENSSAPEHGTKLRMTEIKNDWVDEDFRELQRSLSRLISPFTSLQDFRIRLEAPEEYERYSTEIGPPELLKYPHYTVTGKISADGTYTLLYSVEGSGHQEHAKGQLRLADGTWVLSDGPSSNSAEAPRCGPLEIELRVWDRDDLGNVVQVTGTSITNIRRELNSYAGINIYRDGFRVLPYGEPNNDWLRLDLRRVQTPTLRLSNNQILGYISISSDGNPELKDQSNREGLRENDAKNDLDQVMIAVLARMEAIRKSARRKNQPKNETEHSSASLFASPDFSGISAHLKDSHPTDLQSQQLVQQIANDFTNKLDQIKKVVARYQGLVTLGQLIDMVLHQGRQPLSKIATESTLGHEEIDDHPNKNDPFLKKIQTRLEKIRTQTAVLDGVFRRVEPFGGRKRGRPGQLYLEKIIEDSVDIFSDKLNKTGVQVDKPTTRTLVTVDAAELQEVFVNLIQNSLYWLGTVDKQRRKISIQVSRPESGVVEIIFADSGPGIPPSNREIIFDPYYSTRPDGTGLGLAVCGDIIRDYYGGTLALLEQHPLGGAAFEITLRKRV